MQAAIKKEIMNILQVLPELNSGGVETGTIDLAKELMRHGHRAVVISNGGKLLKELLSMGAVHYELPVHDKSLFTVLKMIEDIKHIIKKENIDIVHARSRVPAFSAFFAARSARVPFITTCHGYYSRHFFSRVMGWAGFVIVPSNVVARHMISDFGVPRDRIRLIPRGVDLDKFEYAKAQTVSQKKEFSIALIGRITPIKGHVYLIRAISKVSRIVPDIKVYIIGEPPKAKPKYKTELESLVKRLNLSGHISFTGDCADIPSRLKGIDLVVVPSVGEETFGRVIIESQAAGVPVIASRIGGIIDIIKDNINGILVNPRDHNKLAEAILRLIKDPALRERIRENARNVVEKEFTIDSMYEKTMKVYQQARASCKILIIKWSALGDIILSLPAFKAVKEKFPSADIALFTSRQGVEVSGRFPYIKDFFVYDNLKGINGFAKLLGISSELRKYQPDIVLDLQNNRKSHMLAFLSLSRTRIGYKSGKLDFLMNNAVSGPKEPLSPLEHQFRLLKHLGIDSIPGPDFFNINCKEEDYARSLIKESWIGENQKIVGFNIASSSKWSSKNWPLEHIAKLADLLARDNIRLFMTGAKHDQASAKNIISLSKSKPFDITGRTSIMQLAAFIKRCDVFVSPDSAPMHIAGLMKVPLVALFGPTDPARHLQRFYEQDKTCLLYKKIKCSPCYRARCRHAKCMEGITPDETACAIKTLLKRPDSRP